jgi:hypothetical protein
VVNQAAAESSRATISSMLPYMIDNASRDRWTGFQGLVRTPEIVIHHVKRNSGGMILNLLAEPFDRQ